MSAVLTWWSFVWQLYLSALQTGNELGGLPMVLIWLSATAAAFAALVVAPVVLLGKLALLSFVLAYKVAFALLFVGTAIETVDAVERHRAGPTIVEAVHPPCPSPGTRLMADAAAPGLPCAPAAGHSTVNLALTPSKR